MIDYSSDCMQLISKRLELIHELKCPADSKNAFEPLTSNRGKRLVLSVLSY